MTSDNKNLNNRLGAHPEPGRLEAHPEAKRLAQHEDDPVDQNLIDEINEVPPVTADVDETPKFVQYGAAVLLGLGFGLGCYLWFGGGNSGNDQAARQAQYMAQDYTTVNPNGELYSSTPTDMANPFAEPCNPILEPSDGMVVPDETADFLGMGAKSESVAPVAADATAPLQEAVAAESKKPAVYLFKYDSTTVPENSDLTAVANEAKKYGYSLDVKAYTDEHGRADYNLNLSKRRAKAIADYLVAHGVPSSKITIQGMGATHAFANDAQDRRAEIYVMKK